MQEGRKIHTCLHIYTYNTYSHLREESWPVPRGKLSLGFGDRAQEGAGSLASADRRGEKGKQP